jgi:hypothetical protein
MRFAVLKTPEGRPEPKLDKVVLIQNFFDDQRADHRKIEFSLNPTIHKSVEGL